MMYHLCQILCFQIMMICFQLEDLFSAYRLGFNEPFGALGRSCQLVMHSTRVFSWLWKSCLLRFTLCVVVICLTVNSINILIVLKSGRWYSKITSLLYIYMNMYIYICIYMYIYIYTYIIIYNYIYPRQQPQTARQRLVYSLHPGEKSHSRPQERQS